MAYPYTVIQAKSTELQTIPAVLSQGAIIYLFLSRKGGTG
jgi:hypothetical protein